MFRILIAAWLTIAGSAISAPAEQRVALVIGNGAYEAVSPLDNPAQDAALIADTLESVGFQVTRLIDSDLTQMRRGISQFGRALREAGTDATGLFYYAGHGVQSFGTNYLLPVDTSLTNAADLDLVAVEAQSVLRQMYSARNRTNIFILDACRNNPFQNLPDFGSTGLAEMKAPTGTFLAYATEPGAVALDGSAGNSPFSAALAAEIPTPGLPLEQVFKQVRVKVLDATRGAQTPWDTSSLTNDFVFQPAETMTEAELAQKQLWDSVKGTGDPVQIMLFLRAYPDSRYDGAARALLGTLMEKEVTTPPAAETAAPTPRTKSPGAREQELINAAQASGALADYEAYLAEFPDGVFAEFAVNEIASLRENQAAATETPDAAPAEPATAPGVVRYDLPLTSGVAEITGKTIAEVTEGSPLFPPIEGLPDEVWKGKHCSDCHQWTREALCTQANVYVTANGERSLDKQHPFGGSFKKNLKTWAADGCQ